MRGMDKKVVILFTNNHMRYYIETITDDSIEQVKKEWGDIDVVIDETDNFNNYEKVQEELYNPTTKHNGKFAVIHWMD